jgi:hypothetical protein
MSFSTFYNKAEFGGVSTKRRVGARKLNCFELLNFVAGKSMTGLFDVKGKKKDLFVSSPFPKKKQPLKIGAVPGMDSAGSHQQNYFFSKE